METKFNFKSQICTSRLQSERLLALGLKKETADMFYESYGNGEHDVYSRDMLTDDDIKKQQGHYGSAIFIPAWSLHRLIEMMPNEIRNGVYVYELNINRTYIHYSRYKTEIKDYVDLEGFSSTDSLYDIIISMLEWLIKEGYFNKEYLENGN